MRFYHPPDSKNVTRSTLSKAIALQQELFIHIKPFLSKQEFITEFQPGVSSYLKVDIPCEHVTE